jgi:Ion channel
MSLQSAPSRPGIPLVHPVWMMRVRASETSNGFVPLPGGSNGFPTGGRITMADDPGRQVQEPRGPHRPRRLIQAFSSPDSYGLVLLLILLTYALSATITSGWATSLVLFVQIATIWATLQASQARAGLRKIASALLVVSAAIAIVHLIIPRQAAGDGVMAVVSGLLYLAAPVIIVRHLVLRRAVDTQTVLGAIAAYLMVGMSFAFAYRALGALQAGPFFGSQGGEGTFSEDLFFSFTTLTTTGYGNLVPATNPGQTFAVMEMLTGQLFLVTAVAKVVSAWRPSRDRGRPSTEDHSN